MQIIFQTQLIALNNGKEQGSVVKKSSPNRYQIRKTTVNEYRKILSDKLGYMQIFLKQIQKLKTTIDWKDHSIITSRQKV